jgi:hypothetical protein
LFFACPVSVSFLYTRGFLYVPSFLYTWGFLYVRCDFPHGDRAFLCPSVPDTANVALGVSRASCSLLGRVLNAVRGACASKGFMGEGAKPSA